jgi:hypothetical protein
MSTPNDNVRAFRQARALLKGNADIVLGILKAVKLTEPKAAEDRGEVIANLMLSYRHLEDAAMRLGKAIQATDGGVSCYDGPEDSQGSSYRTHDARLGERMNKPG